MRIAFLVRRLFPPGGSERSLLYLKDRLDEEHQVRVFGYYTEKPDTPINGIVKEMPSGMGNYLPETIATQIQKFRIPFGFTEDLNQFSPDLIIAQHELSYLAGFWKFKEQVPYITFIRDKSMLSGLVQNQNEAPEKILGLFHDSVYYPFNRFALHNSNLVIANSEYISNIYRSRFPKIEPIVVYPFVKIDDYLVDPGNKILHVDPRKKKGIEITLRIAELMPQEEFVIVGRDPKNRIKSWIKKLDNVRYLGFVEDMKDAYKLSKLVVYPSKWDEPFGRVPLEAGASGIPTVASGTGGLSESVGTPELIVPKNKPEVYREKIQSVLKDYHRFSRLAKENAIKQSADPQFERFIEEVRRVLPKHGF